MRLAIVAPSAYRFIMGGAEHFCTGLQRYINDCTPHDCEVIKTPTQESSLLQLVRAYRGHARTDVLGYDRIVSVKYPAWMTLHPNHALYMLHTLRGLYDTYHFAQEPLEPDWTGRLGWIREGFHRLQQGDPCDNAAAIDLLNRIEDALLAGAISEHDTRFPGPLTRFVVQALDRFALQPARIASYATMCRNVTRRDGYFPPSVTPQVVPPPPRLEGLRCGRDDYLFTVSRLDGPKRIGLLIEAMRYVSSDIPLLIAGSGPDEQRLREMAAGDPRVRFLGRLSDQQLIDCYADALAVPFVPYDEDYGLVTIEAMRSGKPVLTVTDSGGVAEFVRHGENGLCVPPQLPALASAIEQLCGDRRRTREMGHAARRSVAHIQWRPLAEQVLGRPLPEPRVQVQVPQRHPRSDHRRKAVVALTFGVTPPRGGGQARAYHLYASLAQVMDVVLVCLCGSATAEARSQIAPGLWEVTVPRTAEHEQADNEAYWSLGLVPVADILASRHAALTPKFLERIDEEAASADLLVACHPYLAPMMLERCPNLPLWYEAQDVELPLKRAMLPAVPLADDLLAIVEQVERQAWLRADVVLACTRQDLMTLADIYGPTDAHQIEVPNGYSDATVRFVTASERGILKQCLGGGTGPLVVFLASWHGPNIEGAKRVLEAAAALPHATFAIAGSAGEYFRDQATPPNVRLLGEVDDEEKQVLLGAADLAVNPVEAGSGSNLKMLDYFAAGVPVLSTEFGARGIDVQPGVHYAACEIEAFLPALVRSLIDRHAGLLMAERAHEAVRLRYSWRSIGQQALIQLARHLA